MATTGTPQANASSTAIGWFSYQRDGTATHRARRTRPSSSALGSRPWKRTRPGARSAAQRLQPGPLGPVAGDVELGAGAEPAMASMSESTPFSADRRPAKTHRPPGALGGASTPTSTKWPSTRSRSG